MKTRLIKTGRSIDSAAVLPLAVLALTAGIVPGLMFPGHTAAITAVPAAALAGAVFLYLRGYHLASRYAVLAALTAAGFLAGSLSSRPAASPLLESLSERTCLVEGEVVGLPRPFPGGCFVVLEALRIDDGGRLSPGDGRIGLWWRGEPAEISPGDIIRAEVELRRPPARGSRETMTGACPLTASRSMSRRGCPRGPAALSGRALSPGTGGRCRPSGGAPAGSWTGWTNRPEVSFTPWCWATATWCRMPS